MLTSTEEDLKKKKQPQLVKLDKAFKLAEQWVNNMSKPSSEGRSALLELKGRPAGLGIGAAAPRESKPVLSNNPVERKLFSKLQAVRRKASKIEENVASDGTNGKVEATDGKLEEESDEDESESKTKAFSKKRPLSLTSPLNSKKLR